MASSEIELDSIMHGLVVEFGISEPTQQDFDDLRRLLDLRVAWNIAQKITQHALDRLHVAEADLRDQELSIKTRLRMESRYDKIADGKTILS